MVMHRLKKLMAQNGKWFLLAGVVAAVLVIVASFMASEGEEEADVLDGCQGDAGCQDDYICALGGCIALILDENADLWREGLNKQKDPVHGLFEPLQVFGTKLVSANECPVREVPISKKKLMGGAVDVKYEITVYAAAPERLDVFKQMAASSTMWMESMLFRFLTSHDSKEVGWCADEAVESIAVNAHKHGSTVKVKLRQSVPSGAEAVAAVQQTLFYNDNNPGAPRQIDIVLAPVFGENRAKVSVLAIPLGSNMQSMEGPVPDEQRLLTGHVAYYWRHGNSRKKVTVTVDLPSRVSPPLNYDEIKPRL